MLTVLPVERAGHCAFEPQEVVGGLAALLLNADSDLVLALMDPLGALHGIVDADIGTGRLAELVQHQASAFLDRLENEFGFLKQARHVTTESHEDGGNADAVQMAWTRCRTWATMPRTGRCHRPGVTGGDAPGVAVRTRDAGGNAAAAAQNGVDPVQDLGDEAEEKIEDLF